MIKKILFVAINSRFNHTNLAVRSICHYIKERKKKFCFDGGEIDFAEYSINQRPSDILRGIVEYFEKDKEDCAPLVLFSVYIWNIELSIKIITEIKKVLPTCIIGAGGPEVSWCAQDIFKKLLSLDLIISGEGEQTAFELATLFFHSESKKESERKKILKKAGLIKGMWSRFFDPEESFLYGGDREPFKDLSCLAFPYPKIENPDTKIFYYESSRGCPFNCAYCLSSIDKRVRFMPLARVYEDIQRFLDARVALVKFVDRTFNLKPERYISIWRYIVEHHNGKTMFHFEIAAEQFSDEALLFLQSVGEGIMQFEIGVQSTHQKTLKAVNRHEDWDHLVSVVLRIPKTIHQHLDLIAGLPYENLITFGKSFDDVLSLNPDVLQLGFLKILSGTKMEEYGKSDGWQWSDFPPYEILSSPCLSYNDVLFLKDIELLLDVVWNSGFFKKTLLFLKKEAHRCFLSLVPKVDNEDDFSGLFFFFYTFAKWCKKNTFFEAPHKNVFWFEALNLFFEQTLLKNDFKIVHELLRFDFLSLGKTSRFPSWCEHYYSKDKHHKALEEHVFSKENLSLEHHSTRLSYAYSEYDTFSLDPSSSDTFLKNPCNKVVSFLFLYPQPKAGTSQKKVRIIKIEEKN